MSSPHMQKRAFLMQKRALFGGLLISQVHHSSLYFPPGPTRPSFHLKVLDVITLAKSPLPGKITYVQVLDILGAIVQPFIPRMPPGFGHPHPCALGHVSFLQEEMRKDDEWLLSKPHGRCPDSLGTESLIFDFLLPKEIKAQRGFALAQDHTVNTR